MRFESVCFFREEKALSLGTKRVIPSSVLLAWFCRVSMTLVDSRYLRNVENGPATLRRSVRLTKSGAGAGAGVGVKMIGGGEWVGVAACVYANRSVVKQMKILTESMFKI